MRDIRLVLWTSSHLKIPWWYLWILVCSFLKGQNFWYFLIWYSFNICRRFCFDGALLADNVGGLFVLDTIDSSDSEIEVLLRFRDGCAIGFAPAATLRFGRRGGSAITDVVRVNVIGGAISDVDIVCCFGGSGTLNFSGIVGIRSHKARDTIEFIDDTQLVLSLIRQCFFLYPSVLFLHLLRA